MQLAPSRPKQMTPRPDQRLAIRRVTRGLRENNRGKLIMACGTGKTVTALWSMERLRAERTLVLLPSLALLRQTIREWCTQGRDEFEFLPVCSDETVRGADEP